MYDSYYHIVGRNTRRFPLKYEQFVYQKIVNYSCNLWGLGETCRQGPLRSGAGGRRTAPKTAKKAAIGSLF